MKSIVVYCGANPGINPIYAQQAYRLGEVLAAKGIRVIYGGGNLGLMGKVANGAIENEGAVTGIIPNFLAKLEVAHQTLTELHLVDTMHERKAKMVAVSDAVIALPGGYGTFDELFEILTWSQLKIFTGPIGLLNTNGYYDLLLQQLDKMVEEGFLQPHNRSLLLVDSDIEGLLIQMESHIARVGGNKNLDRSLYVDDGDGSTP
ncbi:LOG family protein [Dyadobacter tibetensis]|uniref:LOG family protein n=1 Tax=Dyadobacter tibetensis TaxID=1211851 RepID=UPI0004716392|nr:TIGR00730 family Rossman fold protein [Dyadobacter tibetensis]